jgi:hypothetical protein
MGKMKYKITELWQDQSSLRFLINCMVKSCNGRIEISEDDINHIIENKVSTILRKKRYVEKNTLKEKIILVNTA